MHSLDSLINDADASSVLRAVLEMDAEMGKAAIRYIGLFRPAKSQLSWARTAKLLNELLPMIKAQEAARDGVCFPAPTEAWIHGFNETVNARDQGRLKLPLKSHGYLLEIVSQWQGSGVPSPQPSPTGRGGEGGAPSKLRQGWQPWANGQEKIGQNEKSLQVLHYLLRSIYPTDRQRRICR
ncbi:hypothetical protein [Neisseria subflava]|uniref:hypothetical protein n=1 Tax=Neisseria subflava TaxID=28449 RepID=UPI0024A98AC9